MYRNPKMLFLIRFVSKIHHNDSDEIPITLLTIPTVSPDLVSSNSALSTSKYYAEIEGKLPIFEQKWSDLIHFRVILEIVSHVDEMQGISFTIFVSKSIILHSL